MKTLQFATPFKGIPTILVYYKAFANDLWKHDTKYNDTSNSFKGFPTILTNDNWQYNTKCNDEIRSICKLYKGIPTILGVHQLSVYEMGNKVVKGWKGQTLNSSMGKLVNK